MNSLVETDIENHHKLQHKPPVNATNEVCLVTITEVVSIKQMAWGNYINGTKQQ